MLRRAWTKQKQHWNTEIFARPKRGEALMEKWQPSDVVTPRIISPNHPAGNISNFLDIAVGKTASSSWMLNGQDSLPFQAFCFCDSSILREPQGDCGDASIYLLHAQITCMGPNQVSLIRPSNPDGSEILFQGPQERRKSCRHKGRCKGSRSNVTIARVRVFGSHLSESLPQCCARFAWVSLRKTEARSFFTIVISKSSSGSRCYHAIALGKPVVPPSIRNNSAKTLRAATRSWMGINYQMVG